MSILDSIFNKHFGPVFLKEKSNAEEFIEKMKALSANASGDLKNEIEEQIAEESRILYVALTRAKEKLIITGTIAPINFLVRINSSNKITFMSNQIISVRFWSETRNQYTSTTS